MPADPHRAVVLRRVEALDGPARVRVVLDLRAAFGRQPMRELSPGRRLLDRPQRRRSGSGCPARPRARPDADGRLAMTLRVDAGQHHDLVLEISDRPLPDAAARPGRGLVRHRERLVRRGARCDEPDRGAATPGTPTPCWPG